EFSQVHMRSRILICIGIVLIFYGLFQLGGIPLLNENADKNRYDKYFWPDYRMAAFLVNRGRESIVIPTSLLLLRWFSGRRTVLDTLLILASCAGCALTATRAPLTLVFLIVLMIMLAMGRVKGLLLMAIGLLTSYLAITALLSSNDLASGGVIESIGVAF